ncbi:MAG TPA: GNAT family N-acetyltransferase [Caulobacteraceae bacterium]|jgi:GNAT superfamily N-acetyltransferase
MSEPAVRPARPEDAAVVFDFVLRLAEYEKLSHAVTASEADLSALLFGPQPRAFCDLVEVDGRAVGFCLWFYTVSTFTGRAGIWIEDLFVLPQARGRGAGLALLKALARRCRTEGLGRLDWAVLDWNAPAIGFYERIGSVSLDDWRLRRLSGDALGALAR